jgi:hypothetical protein
LRDFICVYIKAAFMGSGWPIVRFGELPEPVGNMAHLPAAMSVKGLAHGVTVVSKNVGFLPWENSLSGDAHFALGSAMGTISGIVGQPDPDMPDDLIRVVVAPRP